MTEISELDLLCDFAQRQSEASFGELVRRYLDLVYSTAMRLVADPHLAQDVSQAVFVALAQQAGLVATKVAQGAALSAWLHLTTRNLAAKTVRTEVRRRAREKEAVAMHEVSDDDAAAAWEQIAPHLDGALGELPNPDRDALLLRFFERKSAREIGQRLGISEEAAQKRVRRALDRLRDRFVARGTVLPVGVSAPALAAILSAKTIEAAPLALSAGIVKASLLAASVATSTAVAPGSITFLSALAMTKTQVAVLLALAAGLAVPVSVQQSALASARATLAGTPAVAEPDTVQVLTRPGSGRARESAAEELTRLQHEGDALRQQLAARRARVAAPSDASGPAPGTVLLRPGVSAAIADLHYAGNATPEAALQSILAYRRDGDVDGASSLMLLSPEKAQQWSEILSIPEQRQELSQEMVAQMSGVVRQSVVRIDAQGVASAPEESLKIPEAPANQATVEITERATLDERRIQLVLHIVRGHQTNTEHLTFGLTRTGWKEIQ